MSLEANFNQCLRLAEQYYGTIDRDLAALILATCVSGSTPGDPVWLMIVGPPSSMKSEHLCLFAPEPFGEDVTSMTKYSLIPKKGRGILHRVINKCMVVSDFSAILGMNPNDLKEVFGYLRRIFDGKVTKDFSGETRRIEGKFSFLGASTEELERHRSTIASLGERFIYVRSKVPPHISWMTPHELKLAREDIVSEIKPIYNELHQGIGLLEVKKDEKVEAEMYLIARARTPIHRHYRTGSVELTPQPEGIMRMYAQTEKLRSITKRLGYNNSIVRVYRGTIPLQRARFLEHYQEGCIDRELAKVMKVGTSTLGMIRTDLQLLEFVLPTRKKGIVLTEDGLKLRKLLGFN